MASNEFDRRSAEGPSSGPGGEYADRLERRVTNLLDRVPGYRGYRAKEDRRDADRRVRDHLASAFGAQADRVERVARDLADRRKVMAIGPVDGFARTIRHLVDRVTTASYGYGGLFGDRDVNAAALDQLRRFDEGLMAGVDELDGPIADLEAALVANGDLATPARAGTDQVRRILARFDLRNQVVEQGEPADEASVLEVLSGPEPGSTPPPAWSLDAGAAVSILGDDFVVDARIDIAGTDPALRLFRLGSGAAERWLLIPARSDGDCALLSPSADGVSPGPPPTIDGKAFAERAGGAGEGESVGVGGASGRRPVRFALLAGTDDPEARAVILEWRGGERQVLVGTAVHPADVEVFGTAPKPT